MNAAAAAVMKSMNIAGSFFTPELLVNFSISKAVIAAYIMSAGKSSLSVHTLPLSWFDQGYFLPVVPMSPC